jgi:F0F1-type ATP synthase assembly protein I
MKQILLRGVVAGFAFFIWLSVIHLATPLAQVGVRAIPNEAVVVDSIKSNVPNPGFYFFPGAVQAPGATPAEKKAAMQSAMERMKTSPTGIMVVYPNGKAPLAPMQLFIEFLNDVVQGVLLAWLLAHSTMNTFSNKLKFALAVGLAATFVTNISYWNWYGFPTDYTLAYMFGEVGGYLVMGLAIAVMMVEKRTAKEDVRR